MSCSYSVPSNNSSSNSSSNSSNEDNMMTNNYNEVCAMASYVGQNLVPELMQPLPTPHCRIRIERHRKEGHVMLFSQCFAPRPTYPPKIFRRRFRMDRHVFLRLIAKAKQRDEYFQQKLDATGRMGLSTLQKCTAVIRMLAYEMASDVVDEYLQLGASSARVALEIFCDIVISQFGNYNLSRPNRSDLERILRIGSERGFPGMLGSIDYMHWEWKNCPSAWKGQYQGRSGKASLVLEVVASHDLWIWHSFLCIPGSLNDINVLHRGYYLTDGIYPRWATFINSIPLHTEDKHKLFAKRQEACRKYVERAFGVLQARFAILRKPSLAWSEVVLGKIITTCIILHNMIVEDGRDRYRNYDDVSEFWADKPKNKGKGKKVHLN